MKEALRLPFRTERPYAPRPARRRRLFGDLTPGRVVLLAAIILVLSAIIHIVTILAIPRFATHDSWSRVLEVAEPSGITLLPPAVPGEEMLPGIDPAIVYGICLFDLSKGPFAIVAAMPGDYWSVAFHTEGGNIFYAVNDEAATTEQLEIEIRNARQTRQFRLEYPEANEDILTIEAPSDFGFALMRSLVASPSERPRVEAAMAATVCENFLPLTPEPELPPEEAGPPLPRPSPFR